MRIVSLVLVSALLGCAIGGAMAYVSIGPENPQSTGLAAGQSPANNLKADLPLVESDELVYHFGTMQKGTTKSHVFKFTNRGLAPLELKAGPSSCKCTMVDLADAKLTEGQSAADKPIPPGGTVGVKLKWTAAVPAGPFRQTAQLFTNDPRSPKLELSVEGDVTEVTGLYPNQFTFDKLRPGEIKTAEVQLIAFGDEPLEIKESSIDPPSHSDHFKIQVSPLTDKELADAKGKSGVRVELTNGPSMPLGLFDQWVVVKTNMPDWEELKIPIVGRVVGDITVHGRAWREELGALHLGVIDGNKGAEVKLLLSTKGEHADDIKFEVGEVDPPQLEVTLGPAKVIKPGVNHTDLLISIPAGTPPMIRLDTADGKQGQIVIKSNHPQSPELVIPIRFAVER